MKPGMFSYVRAHTVDEAVRALVESDGAARLLAGGQSLAPMMHMRLMRPDVLVDLNRIPELAGLSISGSGTAIGAMTRYSEIEHSALVSERLPLLSQAIGSIGDRQVRNRGTIGGSLAQADPTAEVAVVCLALDAAVVLQGPDGTRIVAVDDFITGAYTTVLEPAEIITEVRFPAGPGACAFSEVGRKHNDFAIASAAACGTRTATGIWTGMRIAVTGIDDRAVLATGSAAAVDATSLDDDAIERAVAAMQPADDLPDDIRASAEYRLVVAEQQVRRVLRRLRDEWEEFDA
jgi:CO/xanthine dehydrogenase FAD-binding subunit